MAEVLYFEINAFALSILFVIFMSMQYRSIRYLTDEKLFLALLAINAIAMILDVITFIADGKSGAIAIVLRYALSPIGYMLTTTSLLLWNLYVRYQVNRDDKNIKKVLIVLVTPVVINAVLAILIRAITLTDSSIIAKIFYPAKNNPVNFFISLPYVRSLI